MSSTGRAERNTGIEPEFRRDHQLAEYEKTYKSLSLHNYQLLLIKGMRNNSIDKFSVDDLIDL